MIDDHASETVSTELQQEACVGMIDIRSGSISEVHDSILKYNSSRCISLGLSTEVHKFAFVLLKESIIKCRTWLL